MYRDQCGVVSDADAESTVIHVYGWYIDDTQMSDACAVGKQSKTCKLIGDLITSTKSDDTSEFCPDSLVSALHSTSRDSGLLHSTPCSPTPPCRSIWPPPSRPIC